MKFIFRNKIRKCHWVTYIKTKKIYNLNFSSVSRTVGLVIVHCRYQEPFPDQEKKEEEAKTAAMLFICFDPMTFS